MISGVPGCVRRFFGRSAGDAGHSVAAPVPRDSHRNEDDRRRHGQHGPRHGGRKRRRVRRRSARRARPAGGEQTAGAEIAQGAQQTTAGDRAANPPRPLPPQGGQFASCRYVLLFCIKKMVYK